MNSLMRNMIGSVLIMAVATAAGITQNALRSQPLALIPKAQTGPAGITDSTAADSAAAGTALAGGLVTTEQVRQALDDSSVFIIDARAKTAFEEGHIAGALNVPYDRFTEYYDFLISTVPMEATVICYCWSPTCDFSDQLAQELRFMGYTNVLIFREGWDAWQETGYASEP